MKKIINSVEYNTKGELLSLEENVITTFVTKKDEEIQDTVDLNELIAEITRFCEANIGKSVEAKFLMRVTEE